MIALDILAGYILIALFTGCIVRGWYEFFPASCPWDEEEIFEEVLGYSTLWPIFWVLLAHKLALRVIYELDEFYYRVLIA